MAKFRKRSLPYWAAIGVVLYLIIELSHPMLRWVLSFPLSEVLASMTEMPWYAQSLLVLKVIAIAVFLLILFGLAFRFAATKLLCIAVIGVAVAEYIVRFQMIGDAATGRDYAEFAGQVFGKALEVGVIGALLFYACNKRGETPTLGAAA